VPTSKNDNTNLQASPPATDLVVKLAKSFLPAQVLTASQPRYNSISLLGLAVPPKT
jgi:hypothetical protein